MSTTIPSTSRADDEDIEMLDADYMHEDVHDPAGRHGDEGDDDDDELPREEHSLQRLREEAESELDEGELSEVDERTHLRSADVRSPKTGSGNVGRREGSRSHSNSPRIPG